MELETYIRASYSVIQMITSEEDRAVEVITDIAKKKLATEKQPSGYGLYEWSVTRGIQNEAGGPIMIQGLKPNENTGVMELKMILDEKRQTKDPVVALGSLTTGGVVNKSIVIMRDFHLHLKQPNPAIIRLMKEFVSYARSRRVHLIIIGCSGCTLPELEKEMLTIDLPLPNREELEAVLSSIVESSNKSKKVAFKDTPENRKALVKAMSGMTNNEAADALSFCISKERKLDPAVVAGIKMDTIKRNGVVDVVETRSDIANVGGLQAAKAWVRKRIKAFSDEARAFGVSPPKGVLAVGISGTGKSLLAKSVASELGVPMLRLEGGRLFGSLVGETEKNMRTALKTADAMAPCVLFIDEIEKAMAGMASSSQCDGGTTSRTIGTLLQWMQDQTGVFVVATANDVSKLPPEMLRRGRFDQIFFVDIPDAEERVEIWKIQINNVKRDPANFDLKELSESTDGYTGAEIESVIKDGMVNAFDCGTEPTTEIFKTAIKETIPLSSTMREKIQSMRRWADGRAVNASGKQIMAEVA